MKHGHPDAIKCSLCWVEELEASEAQLALALESQDRTLIRYREALTKIASEGPNYSNFFAERIANEALKG